MFAIVKKENGKLLALSCVEISPFYCDDFRPVAALTFSIFENLADFSKRMDDFLHFYNSSSAYSLLAYLASICVPLIEDYWVLTFDAEEATL